MEQLITELKQEELEAIYGGARYVWMDIDGVKTLVLINAKRCIVIT